MQPVSSVLGADKTSDIDVLIFIGKQKKTTSEIKFSLDPFSDKELLPLRSAKMFMSC